MKPIKYYQIVTPGVDGVLRPFDVSQFGEGDGLFSTQEEAERFIEETFDDAQEVGSFPPSYKKDLGLSVLPVWLVRFKK